MNDYLWDKSDRRTADDADIERLERALARFAQSAPPPPFAVPPARTITRPSRWIGFALIAATLALVVGGMMLAMRFRSTAPGWQVTTADGRSTLQVGSWLETGARERATFDVATLGQVTMEPNTRLRLVNTRAGDHRLALAYGTLRATIWAPPNQFFVETPSSLAIDLGCAYTLTVDDEGAGLVNVLVGWVGFKWRDRESFIPAGSSCQTRPRVGPGTPYNDRVSPAYREALATLDFNPASSDAPRALTRVLDESTERDEVTLWHLLSRVAPPDRDRVFDRLAAIAAPPAGVMRDGIRAGKREMLDAWWDSFGLGSTSVLRSWSQQWKDN